jgi:hypothetical protein
MDRLIKLAYSFDGWIFGGYVRDVIVLKQNKFEDVDIMFPCSADVTQFLKCLSAVYGNDFHINEDRVHGSDMYMDRHITRRITVDIHDNIDIDICVYDGTFDDWRSVQSTDFSCNLFYTSKDVQLGIRYIPKSFSKEADPIGEIIRMTLLKKFELVWDGDYNDIKKMRRLATRAIARKDDGWIFYYPLFDERVPDDPILKLVM